MSAAASAERPGTASSHRALVFLAGFNLILLNYTLIRTMTLVFGDLETSALLMTVAYFAGVSLGYVVSDRAAAPRLSRLLPLFLVFQLGLVSIGPLLILRLADAAGTKTAYVVVVILVMLGSTSIYSILLPRAIQSEEGSTRRYYAIEILGSLSALAALPLLGLGGMTLFYAAYLVSYLVLAARLGTSRILLVVLAGISLLFLAGFDRVDRWSSALFYARVNPRMAGSRVVYCRYTPYHKIEVLDRDAERFLYLNAHRQFRPSSYDNYSYFAAAYPAHLLGRPRVCVLGCGAMATVGRMGESVESIRIVDLDRGVFDTARTYFAKFNRLGELRNWTFESDDAKHFLGTQTERFDLIIDDIPPARTRQVALTYTREFFSLVKARLRPGGIFSLPSLTPMDAERQYGRRMLATLHAVFDRVYVLNWGNESYYYATDRTRTFSEDELYAAIDHPDKEEIEIVMPKEARDIVEGATVITVNNMADLILE